MFARGRGAPGGGRKPSPSLGFRSPRRFPAAIRPRPPPPVESPAPSRPPPVGPLAGRPVPPGPVAAPCGPFPPPPGPGMPPPPVAARAAP